MTQDEPRDVPTPPQMPSTSLPDARGQATPSVGAFQRRSGKTRNPWGVWLLTLVTLGIYGLYWYYKINEETRDYEQSIKVDPTVSLLAILVGWLLCVIPAIVSIINTGSRIQEAQKAAGASERCSGGLGILFAILGGFHHVYYQSQLNKVWDQHGNPDEDSLL